MVLSLGVLMLLFMKKDLLGLLDENWLSCSHSLVVQLKLLLVATLTVSVNI